MGTGTNIYERQNTDPLLHNDRSIVTAQRSALLAIVVFVVLASLTGAIIYQRYINKRQEKKEEAITVANNARVRLQESLAFSLSATKTLSFFIQDNGTVKNFDSIASQILNASDDIDALQLVPDGVIRYIYPLDGNEKAIGYDILRDPLRNKEAYKAIGKKEMFFAGPFELKQGGMGVVGRLPIFRKNKFWGFSAVVIKMPTLLRSAGIDSSGSSGYYFQLSKINPDTKQEEYFIKHPNKISNAQTISVNVPNGEWKLSVNPVKPLEGFENIIILAILGFLFSALGAILIYSVSRRPKKLDELVRVRTKQLQESEENYKILFERSPLPLWIYDKETFQFLEVNDAAINLYGYSRDEFQQMDVLQIRRPEDIDKFLDDNRYASDELREAGVWTHLKKNREEIQVLVFTRNLPYKGRMGRLVLLMNVSEKIKIENELIKSEEKYRSLIEQASDGIILYSFDGTIHSFNKAACDQTGYTNEEFEQLNLKDLFFEKSVEIKRSKDSKMDPGKATTLYRKLKRKDGSILLVELNARMLPDGKIIAIVRDVTEREKTEEALKESEEKHRTLVERVTDAFISLDNDGNFTYVNKTAGEIYKVKPENLIGKSIWKAFPDGVDLAFQKRCNEAMSSQEYQFLEEYYPPLERWFENHIYPSMDGLTIFFKDVTEIKKTLIALEEKEIKYRSLIEQASDGIVITDLEGNIQEANNSVARMSGYDLKEIVGKHLNNFLPSEDATLNPIRLQELIEGKIINYERRLKRKDGTILEIEGSSKMASSNTLIAFVRDITERKKNEDILRRQARLLDAVSDAITSLDMNRNIVSWNESCEELYGFTKAEAIGKRIPQLVTFEFPGSNAEDVFKQVFTEGRWKGEFNFIHPKTAVKVYLLSSINLIKNPEGNINGFIITSKDISYMKKVEAEIKSSNERFELIAQATNDAVWDHDFAKNETWGNKKLYSLYGIQPGAGKIDFEMFLEQIHPDERAGIAERMKEAISKSVSTISEEFRFKTADGEYRNFYDRAYIKYDHSGRPIKMLGAMHDITDREMIRKQIIKEKELSDSIINSLPGVFYLYNQDGKFLRWNKNFETVTGYTGEEISRMHPLDFFDKNDHELLSAKIQNVFISGEDHVEADFLLKDKQKIPYYFTGQAIEYEGEKCLMGVGLDFSEREKAARTIRESEEKYRTLVEQASDGIFIADKQGRFLVVNSSGYNMSQYSHEELSNMTIYDLVPEEDLENDPFRFQEMKDGKVARSERRMKRKDGSVLEVEVTAKYISGERFLAFIRDVSEREKAARAIRASEEKYRTIIEQASDGIFIADNDFYFIDVNSAGCRMLGYSKEELCKMKFTTLIPAGDLGTNPVQFYQLNNGDTVINERRLTRKDGSVIEVEISAKKLFDGRYQSMVRDITERKKAENALRESEERYKSLVENAPEALVVLDVKKQQFVNVSESATKLFKMSKEELLKVGPVALSPEKQPNGELSSEMAMNYIQQAIDGDKPSFEWMHFDSEGNQVPCEIRLVRLPSENSVLVRGSIVDITVRKKVAEEIAANSELMRELYSYSQNIREEERTYIAREIHDELGQQLTGLKMDLSWINRRLKTSDELINEKLTSTIGLIDNTIKSVRKIATELRPSILDDLGLVAALEWQGDEFGKRAGTKVNFRSNLNETLVLPGVTTAMFRIYQELLTNIARHADATIVNTSIYINNNKLYLSVEDNGIGFDINDSVRKKTLGLRGIQERTNLIGGAYEIKSKPGEGTFVLISVPL